MDSVPSSARLLQIVGIPAAAAAICLMAGCANPGGNQNMAVGQAPSANTADSGDLVSIAKELCTDNRTMTYDIEGRQVTRRFEGASMTTPGLCQETLSEQGQPDRKVATVFGMFSGQYIYDATAQFVYDPAGLARGIAPVLQGKKSDANFTIDYVGGVAQVEFRALSLGGNDKSEVLVYEFINHTLHSGIPLPQPNKAFLVAFSRPSDKLQSCAPLFLGERDAQLGAKWPWKTMKLVGDLPR